MLYLAVQLLVSKLTILQTFLLTFLINKVFNQRCPTGYYWDLTKKYVVIIFKLLMTNGKLFLKNLVL